MSRGHTKITHPICRIRFALMGPAFIAAIGYIDPGNFVTNIQAGAKFGYKLLWVVIYANTMAIVIQLLSAKLGIATGKNLAEQIRDRFPKPLVWFYWIQAEFIAIATDLAEFIGSAIGFKIILGVSLLHGAIFTGIATCLILMLQKRGKKSLEKCIGGLLVFIAFSYVIELAFSKPRVLALVKGMACPSLPTSEAVFFASSVLGATVMPHVIYLHSFLTQSFQEGTYKEQYRTAFWDVIIAMTIASFVNLAMMATASIFYFNGNKTITNLDQAYLILKPLLSQNAATIFGLSLVASGLSSTVVGTLAGQVIMQGFVHFYIPVWVRRVVTMLPSFILILMKVDSTQILVMSQVLLSFGISLALIPLLIFTSRESMMGQLVNNTSTKYAGWLIVFIVIGLNIWLVIQTISTLNKFLVL